jgi:hypothetical protein
MLFTVLVHCAEKNLAALVSDGWQTPLMTLMTANFKVARGAAETISGNEQKEPKSCKSPEKHSINQSRVHFYGLVLAVIRRQVDTYNPLLRLLEPILELCTTVA